MRCASPPYQARHNIARLSYSASWRNLTRVGGPAGRGRRLLAADLTLKRPDQFCSVEQGIYGHFLARNSAGGPTDRLGALRWLRL